jgi:GTP cyclohydrolase II
VRNARAECRSCYGGRYRGEQVGQQAPTEPLAIIYGDVASKSEVAVRVHDACFTSEVLGSMKCDCAEQLNYALDYIKQHDGIVVYLQQVRKTNNTDRPFTSCSLRERFESLRARAPTATIECGAWDACVTEWWAGVGRSAQEGRGIGLANKIAAYHLQESGLDTVDANRALNLPDDSREYTAVANMLRDMDVKSIKYAGPLSLGSPASRGRRR